MRLRGKGIERCSLGSLGVVLEVPGMVLGELPLLDGRHVARVCEVHVLPVQEPEREKEKLESVSPPPPSALGEFDDSSVEATGRRNLHSEPRWAGAVRAANNADAFELDVASEAGRESE